MRLQFSLLFILTLITFSCNIESIDSDEQQDNNDGVLIKKMIYDKGTDDEYIATFNYNGNKLINVDYGTGSKNVYTYDSNNNLVRDDYFEGTELVASVVLEYNSDGKIASYVETFFDGSGLANYIYKNTFNYNPDGTITNDHYIGDSNSNFVPSSSETITFLNQNLKEILHDDGYSISYTYDDKDNPFKNIYPIEVLNILSETEYGAYIYGNTNNMTNRTESGTGVFGTYQETYEYTYNDKGYPITAINKFKHNETVESESTIEFVYE